MTGCYDYTTDRRLDNDLSVGCGRQFDNKFARGHQVIVCGELGAEKQTPRRLHAGLELNQTAYGVYVEK